MLGWPASSLRAEPDSPSLSLSAKAEHFREALVRRHVSREGLLLYRVNLSTIERDRERGTYPALADTPTFTGIWAATSCLRATLEPKPRQALSDASQAIAGLELLMNVTGRTGLMARAVRRDDGRDTTGMRRRWFPGGPGYERYVWRGDVSMDQYANGLLPAVAACAGFFPDRMRRLVTDAATHLLEHDLQLVDADGETTRFGDLSPDSGYGFNTIAMLTGYGIFAWAAALDSDPRFARERDRLRDRHRVVARARRTNVRLFAITNHSNDLMAWDLYRSLIPLAERTGDPASVDLRHGMHRAWLRVRPDGNAYFATLSCVLEATRCDREALAAARRLLERFPLEKRRLEPARELAAIPRRWLPGRKWVPLAREPVPIEIRSVSSFEWKSSPYRLARPAAPQTQYTGLDFLAAYWLLRAVESSDAAAGAPVASGGARPAPAENPARGTD